jgi:DNA-binding NarL/FixJ family response regulator
MTIEPGGIELKQKSIELTRVMIADDHPLVRQALRQLLENQSDIQFVGEASDGEEAIELASQLLPDIVIMDITMPKINGIEATLKIKAAHPMIKILALTIHSDSEFILGILESGAAGYLTKSVFGEEVIVAIRAIMAGESVISSPLLATILQNSFQYPKKPLPSNLFEKLSSRELEILKMFARGKSNKDIAGELNLSLQTIKGYSVSIFSKLQVGSRTEAVIAGLRAEILTLKDLY